MLSTISGYDYGVLALSLVLPVVVSLYFGCFTSNETNGDFLMGGRKVGVLPLSVSLAMTYFTAGTITGREKIMKIEKN